jgi:hypothetical protein
MTTPDAKYRARLAARTKRTDSLSALDGALGWGYLAGVGALLGALYLVAERGVASPGWLLVPLLLLAATAAAQAAIRSRLRASRRAAAFYERGLARLDGTWRGVGPTGERFAPPDHPFALDLDVVGRGSVFQRICETASSAGEAALARTLLSPPAPVGEIRARQALVAGLRDRLDLREALATLRPDLPDEADPAELVAWAEAPTLLPSPNLLRLAAAALPAAALAAGLGWATSGWGPLPLVAALGVGSLLSRHLAPRVATVTSQLWRAQGQLDVLGRVAARLERERFDPGPLAALQRGLLEGGGAARPLGALARRAARLTALQGDLAQPIARLFGGVLHQALAVEAWRRRHGAHVRGWVDALGRLEAGCSLAGYAFEHPADPFPELVDGGPIFDAAGLGHPLLPASSCVRNDLRLGEAAPSLLLLSGSNMSGKSTFLRAVGVNAVLAFAGAPVRAERLRLSPLALGASLRTQDSLAGGASRFYAEITRLRLVVDLLDGDRPVLFLLDEILSGTNSHDRRVGVQGVLGALVARGAVGLCTTHDLALAQVVDAIGPRAVNGHFGDRLVDGRLQFEYRLRPGVVRHSNALELMRAVGLRV